ncbi:hypothetical protein A2U01_0093041, partial [Trifolium medium]|nr:hypothetical protein [Trifolium medium]
MTIELGRRNGNGQSSYSCNHQNDGRYGL